MLQCASTATRWSRRGYFFNVDRGVSTRGVGVGGWGLGVGGYGLGGNGELCHLAYPAPLRGDFVIA